MLPFPQRALPRFGFEPGFQVDRSATTEASPVSVLIASPAQRHTAFKLVVVHPKLATGQELPSHAHHGQHAGLDRFGQIGPCIHGA
jgi:hypothetical protein